MSKIKKFFKNEFDHILTSRLEQMKYELQEEVKTLEKAYENTKSQFIWEKLELKRQELANVSARLAEKRTKNDR
ncbi:MAG: hypothetical protein HW420_1594 [Candidatus Nitrosotenuis sp.]|nr:hypothetical protein [Candidatus Nitrosotenuis sp.]